MGSRINFIFVLGIFSAVILFSCFADASLACGQVNSTGGMEPQWMKVRIYSQDKNNFTTCSVSPSENKFCCDTEKIFGNNWAAGKQVIGGIFNEAGYFAGPVSLYTSGEGYDVFPLMELKKAIILNNLSKVVFSNEPRFLLNARFSNPFNFTKVQTNGEIKDLCNCDEYVEYINGSFGMNSFKITAGDGQREFVENFVVAILKSFEFNRTIECEKCKNNLVKSDKEAVIKLSVSLSHPVEGMELKEYVPKDFDILETDGQIREYSETHNVIIWNVSGKIVSKSYKVRSPKVSFFPRKYVFRSELEDALLREDKITVSRFFSFWSFDEGIEFKQVKKQVYSRVSPSSPLVFKFKNKEIIRIAIFPKKTINAAEFSVEEYQGDIEEDEVNYYSLDTNIETEDIEKIFVEFRVPKNYSGNLSLYVFENGWEEWEDSQIKVSGEDKEYVYYQAYVPSIKKIALVGKEEGAFKDFLRIFG